MDLQGVNYRPLRVPGVLGEVAMTLGVEVMDRQVKIPMATCLVVTAFPVRPPYWNPAT